MNDAGFEFCGLRGKTAIVTGAAAGIGRAILDTYVAAGARVIAVDRDAEKLAHACALPALRAHTHPVVADLAHQDEILRVAEAVRDLGAVLHVLCNNAGITTRAPLPELDRATWASCIDIDLVAPYALTRAVLPFLEAARSASVINMSSIHARLTSERMAVYAAAKAGLLGLTRALANELGPRGIRVNALCPGYIDTGYIAPMPPAVAERIRMTHPLRRFGEPRDVAGPALFLAGDMSSFVSGAVITVDGGLGVRLPGQQEE